MFVISFLLLFLLSAFSVQRCHPIKRSFFCIISLEIVSHTLAKEDTIILSDLLMLLGSTFSDNSFYFSLSQNALFTASFLRVWTLYSFFFFFAYIHGCQLFCELMFLVCLQSTLWSKSKCVLYTQTSITNQDAEIN